jgi:hypothetical protein
MWLIPSRKRPNNLARLLKAMDRHGAEARCVVRVDDDDDIASYRDVCGVFDAELIVGPRVGCSASYNEIFARYPDEPWYGCIQDDVIPETSGFESALVKHCIGGLSYPDDGLQGRILPTNPVIDGDVARKLGWAALPRCRHYYIDNAWRDIGRSLKHLMFCNVKMTHLHPLAKKAENDAVYDASKAGALEDRRAYANWLMDEYEDVMKRLGVA